LKEKWEWTPRPELQLSGHAQTLLRRMYEQKKEIKSISNKSITTACETTN